MPNSAGICRMSQIDTERLFGQSPARRTRSPGNGSSGPCRVISLSRRSPLAAGASYVQKGQSAPQLAKSRATVAHLIAGSPRVRTADGGGTGTNDGSSFSCSAAIAGVSSASSRSIASMAHEPGDAR